MQPATAPRSSATSGTTPTPAAREGRSSLPLTTPSPITAISTTSSTNPRAGNTVTTIHYGPPRLENLTRGEKDMILWKWLPQMEEYLKNLDKVVKKRETVRGENMISVGAAQVLEALTVTKLDLHIVANALEHHTVYYHCTKGDKAQAVLRRGQEFTVTVTFSRAYQKDKDDLVFIFNADETDPGTKNLKERFILDEDGTTKYKELEEWGARIVSQDHKTCSMKLAVYVPADCPVGEWELSVQTQLLDKVNEDYVYLHPSPLIVLFNPWAKGDLVHFTDNKDLLKEYILNSAGTYYCGTGDFPMACPWIYGQFDEGVLEVSLSLLRKAFGFKMTPAMADPVLVARALSRIVNSADDNGLLVGNWSGNYTGGRAPTFWESSADILRQFAKTGQPVKFGQCWVFSHVLTAVCRALGLPCRSVTTFSSAHDSDNTCTIDLYFTLSGEELEDRKNDSIWNFHVWNEVWILRPDLSPTGQYDGWQAIDATPQEQSYGVYQCGPCPVAAIKNGDVHIGYDTPFVYSEVNADVVEWVVDDNGQVIRASAINKTKVGMRISTKVPDGKGYNKMKRLDVTDNYKYPEGSDQERNSMRRAIRFTCHGKKLFPENANLDVTFDLATAHMLGKDLVMKAFVKNLTNDDRAVTVLLAIRTCNYWDRSNGVQSLAKVDFPLRTIGPDKSEEYTVTVKAEEYFDKMDEQMNFVTYACATDVNHNMPYSSQHSFSLQPPELVIEGPTSAVSGQVVTVTASFLSPFTTKTLHSCSWMLSGDLLLAEDDSNKAVRFGDAGYRIDKFPNVKGKQRAALTLRVYGTIEPEEDGRRKTLTVSFSTKDFDWFIKGSYTLKLTKPLQPPGGSERPADGAPTPAPPAPAATQPVSGPTQPSSGTAAPTAETVPSPPPPGPPPPLPPGTTPPPTAGTAQPGTTHPSTST